MIDCSNLEKKSHIELVKELSELEKKISLLTLQYELTRLELVSRFPMLENSDEFKSKIKSYKNAL